MRGFSHSRWSRLLVGSLALLMGAALVSPREWSDGRGRDNAIRTTRGGVLRLDATDAIGHGYEDAEIVVAPQTDLVVSSAIGLDTPPGPALCPAAPAAPGPDLTVTLLVVGPLQPRALSQPAHPTLGRAPPLA